MARLMIIAVLLTAGATAHGQDAGGRANIVPGSPDPGQAPNKDHLAPTGKTMPQPGVPQASGPTALDRKIQQENNKIDNSICQGC